MKCYSKRSVKSDFFWTALFHYLPPFFQGISSTGYLNIGSHTCVELLNNGTDIVIDNFSNSNPKYLKLVMKQRKFLFLKSIFLIEKH